MIHLENLSASAAIHWGIRWIQGCLIGNFNPFAHIPTLFTMNKDFIGIPMCSGRSCLWPGGRPRLWARAWEVVDMLRWVGWMLQSSHLKMLRSWWSWKLKTTKMRLYSIFHHIPSVLSKIPHTSTSSCSAFVLQLWLWPGLPRTLLAALEGRLGNDLNKASCKTHLLTLINLLSTTFLQALLRCNIYIYMSHVNSINCGFKCFDTMDTGFTDRCSPQYAVLSTFCSTRKLSSSQFCTPKPRCMPFNKLLQQKEFETVRQTNCHQNASTRCSHRPSKGGRAKPDALRLQVSRCRDIFWSFVLCTEKTRPTLTFMNLGADGPLDSRILTNWQVRKCSKWYSNDDNIW